MAVHTRMSRCVGVCVCRCVCIGVCSCVCMCALHKLSNIHYEDVSQRQVCVCVCVCVRMYLLGPLDAMVNLHRELLGPLT